MKINKITRLYLLLFTLFIYSCEKEEQPIDIVEEESIEKEDVSSGKITASVFIEPDYKYQVFYDLETNVQISKKLTTSWDLAFECGEDGYHTKLNSSRVMKVWSTGKTNFSEVQSTANAEWEWDDPNGSLDLTGIGEWGVKNGNDIVSNNHVFVLDLGKDSEGDSQGYKKMQILGLEDDAYRVKIADLSGENEFTKVIQKDNDYNFVFLSIGDQGEMVSIEPPKDDWDLVFTKYTHTFYNPTIAYGVSGVLINSNATSIHQDTIYGFENIDFEIAKGLNYITDHNTIGYDWKSYNHDSRAYTMDPDNNYIIKNRSGNYYKFHLIDFYNETGQKGNIKFEFQKL